jgi:hypothetical protein
MSMPAKTCRNCGGSKFYESDCARTVAISITPFSLPPKFHLRICGNCGLVDWFLPDKDLKKLSQKLK